MAPPWAERAERARLVLGATKEVRGFIDFLDFNYDVLEVLNCYEAFYMETVVLGGPRKS